MIIKRYDGSEFQELFPKTISQRIFTNDGATQIFDSNGKLKTPFLPDEVFGGMKLVGTVSNTGGGSGPFPIVNLLSGTVTGYSVSPTLNTFTGKTSYLAGTNTVGGSKYVGHYWVVTNNLGASGSTASQDVVFQTVGTASVVFDDGANPTNQSGNLQLEAGDWIVITGWNNADEEFNVSIVNNTYANAFSTVHGVVKLASDTQQSTAAQGVSNTASRTYGIQNNANGQLVVNVPWQNTVFTHPTFTEINANAVNNGVNVVDNISVNTDGHVTAVGLRNLSNATTSAAGVMSGADKDKLDGIASGAQANVATNLSYTNSTRVIASSTGNNATLPLVTTSIDGLMSNDDKSKLDGIASGAQANVGTNIAQGTRTTTTVPVTSSTGNNATLDIATTTLAGVMSSADKTKLNGIAAGATTNTGTVTSITVAAGSGMSGGGTVTTSGTVTLTNTAQNATHTGDVTGSAALTIVNNKVTNAKLADMPGFRIKGKNTSGTADPMDLTTAQVRTLTNTVALFFQTTAPTVHADGVALQAGTLWFDTSA